MQKNDQLVLAYNFVQFTDKNIFLTGKAGTGKTTFLHNLKKDSLKRMVIVAPTGVAAINAGGVTIHSFFQLPFGPFIAQELDGSKREGNNAQRNRKFNRDKINVIQSLDLLVIDEISMVRADLLDGIDEVLRRYKNHSKPFGGVQLLMIGDLHQLSPVIKEDDWKLLKDYYPNLYFFSSKALQKAQPVCIELKHIYRQSDTHFIDLLNRVRQNQIDAQVLQHLNQRYIPDFNPSDEEGYITLTSHNNTAQQINEIRLSGIKASTQRFTAVIHKEFPEYNYPTVVNLDLKVGAQVMFVKNDPSREKQFYNGKIGKVTKIENDIIFVKCPGEFWEIEVTPAEWENIKYELNAETKEVEEKVAGTFIQYPLKLAWAITIHKSQGLTFEKAIIDASSSFAHGQVYVALSRCKSFEGMVLRSPLALNSIKTDGTVFAFSQKADENAPGEKQLLQSKFEFQRSLLFELFDFTLIKSRFFYCNRLVEENDHILAASVKNELTGIKETAEKNVYTVADTFNRELHRLLGSSEMPEENHELQDRLKKASVYFADKVEAIYSTSVKIVVETDNKTVRKSITDALDNLKKETFIKLSGLKLCASGFKTMSYLKNKANAELDYSNVLVKEEMAPKPKTPRGVAHHELYVSLKHWRDDLAIQNNVPVYLVLPSKVLTQLVQELPSNNAGLEKIKGIGKQKVRQFGKEILEIIADYCEKNSIKQEAVQLTVK
ncbi:HRDC domain-containing protein [Desertivirga xinjiangensis]|uniref:HRDC domain-containing protein n=1 Tax=Desertivirga xinjiangensis TaxID=539206 RepID=UPI00210DD740|nr:HRDC domain-containing protein [Pedobacter xinjiangensis]